MHLTLADEIRMALSSLAIHQNQFDNASGPFVDVAAKRVEADRAWLNALYATAKEEKVTV